MPESEETTVIITNVTLLCAAFEIVGKQLIILFSLFFFFSLSIRGFSAFHSNYIHVDFVMNEVFDFDRSWIRPTDRTRKLWARVIGSTVNYICHVICLMLQSNPFYFESIRFYLRRECGHARALAAYKFHTFGRLTPFTCK